MYIAKDVETRFDTANNKLQRPCLEQEIKVPSEKWMMIDNIIDPTDCFNEIKKQKQIYKKQKNIGGILKETEKFNEKNA